MPTSQQGPTPPSVQPAPPAGPSISAQHEGYQQAPLAQQGSWLAGPSQPHAPCPPAPTAVNFSFGTAYGAPGAATFSRYADYDDGHAPAAPMLWPDAQAQQAHLVDVPTTFRPSFTKLDVHGLTLALQPYTAAASTVNLTDAPPSLANVNVRAAPEVFGRPRRTFPLAPSPSQFSSSSSSEVPLATSTSTPSSWARGTASSATSLTQPSAGSSEATTPASHCRHLAHVLGSWGYDAHMVNAVTTGIGGSQSLEWLAMDAARFDEWGYAPAAIAELAAKSSPATLAALVAYTPSLRGAGLSVTGILRLCNTAGPGSLAAAAGYEPLLTGQGMATRTFLRLMFANPGPALLNAVAFAAATTRALGLSPESLVSVALGLNGEAAVLAFAECGPDLCRRGADVEQLARSLSLPGGVTRVREIAAAKFVYLGQPKVNKGKRKASEGPAAPHAG